MSKKLLSIMLAVMLVATTFVCTVSAATQPTGTLTFGEGGEVTEPVAGQNIGGLGGKAENETAWAYKFDASTNVWGGYQYTAAHPSEAHAYTFNMYADGDAVAYVLLDGNYFALTWEANGDLKIGNTVKGQLARGQWHRVTIWYAQASGWITNQTMIFADGVRYDEDSAAWKTSRTQYCFGGKKGDGAGTVAFADGLYYDQLEDNLYADYQTFFQNDAVAAYESSQLVIDTANKIIRYNPVQYRTAEALAATVTDTQCAATARVFTDSTLETIAETLDATSNIAVLTSVNGCGYEYYKLEALPLSVMMELALRVTDTDGTIKNRVKLSDTEQYTGLYVYSGNYETVLTDGNKRIADPISSAELLAALSSENGYILSYADDNKMPTDTDSVTGGFIKAEKEGAETIYLPIAPRTEAKTLAFPADFNVGGDGADPTSAENVAGKPGTVSGVAYNNASGNDKRYIHNPSDWYTTYTYTFNMYADGDAVGFVGFAGGHGLLEYNADGTVSYYDDSWKTSDVTLERGQWHKIAVTYDSERCRFVFFADGKLIIPDGRWMQNGADMHFGSARGQNGRVLFDHFVTYEGYYDSAEDVIAAVKSDNVWVDAANKMIYYQNISTPAGLENAVKTLTGAADAVLYTDDSVSEKATLLANGENVMVLTTGGHALVYYGIADMPPAISDITFGRDGDSMKAYVTIYDCDENVTLYIASYQNGKLIDVDKTFAAAGTNPGVTEAKVSYREDCTVKAFLWSDTMRTIRFAQ